MKNPIKRGLARELNPGTEVGSVTALEGLSQAAARQQIAQNLTGKDFATFVNHAGGPAEHRPVAVLADPVKKALGAKTGIVRLSSYTVAKQRIHRRGQTFTAADYHRVQDMLDKGMILQESKTHMAVFYATDGVIWKAVVKRTKAGDELYLQTLHRSDSARLRSAKRKHRILNEEKG